MAGLRVVEAHAVQQNERLSEGGAADGEIGDETAGSALLQVERRIELEQVEPGVEERALFFRQRQYVDVAIGFIERGGFGSTRDYHAVVMLWGSSRALLGVNERGGKRQSDPEFHSDLPP